MTHFSRKGRNLKMFTEATRYFFLSKRRFEMLEGINWKYAVLCCAVTVIFSAFKVGSLHWGLVYPMLLLSLWAGSKSFNHQPSIKTICFFAKINILLLIPLRFEWSCKNTGRCGTWFVHKVSSEYLIIHFFLFIHDAAGSDRKKRPICCLISLYLMYRLVPNYCNIHHQTC